MSNFFQKMFNPITQQFETAEMLDDVFGKHKYGVRFSGSDKIWTTEEIEKQENDHFIADTGGPQK